MRHPTQNRPPVGRNSKHVSLQTTRLWGLSCTVRHAISKTTAGRSKFQIRVGTYNSCLEPAYLRSQLPSNSDFPISWSFALSLLLKFRSISNAIVYCSLKIKLTFLGISRKYFKDLFKKISSAAHGAKNCIVTISAMLHNNLCTTKESVLSKKGPPGPFFRRML